MATNTTTYTFNAVRAPQVDLTVEVTDTTGQTFYTAVVNLLELDPARTTNGMRCAPETGNDSSVLAFATTL